MTDHAIAFDCEGERLIGVVSEPQNAARVGVLVIVGGPQYRVGSHRQFLLLARRLTAAGFAVMRFDYRGIGDSSGAARSFEETAVDIAAAIDAFRSRCATLERIVLWGLCDAASAALLYWDASEDPRVGGMVLLNPWVFSDETFARTQLRHHYRRLLQRDFWGKVARGEFEVGGALKWAAGRVRTLLARTAQAPGELPFQRRMRAALARFRGPVLLVLSGQDLTAKGFLEHCEADAQWRETLRRPNIERTDLPGADHSFADGDARQALETLHVEWLARAFG